MLDLLFRKMGYVPAASASLVDDSPGPTSAPLPAHRRDEAAFDYGMAQHDDLCLYYRDGGDEAYRYAVGRNEWAPLVIAGLILAPTLRCEQVAQESLISRLAADTDVLASWREANADVFGTLRDGVEGPRLCEPLTSSDFDERKTATLLGTAEIASLLAMCWQRARLESPVYFRANSEAYVMLATHHAMIHASSSAEHALERALEWLTVWFESRGLRVDRARRLVNEISSLMGRESRRSRSDHDRIGK